MRSFILLALTCSFSIMSAADICIPDPLVVHSVQGIVLGPDDKPMVNVKVQLLDKGEEKIVAETLTDSKGRFHIKAKPGRYWLRAREPHVGRLAVETTVKRERSDSKLELIRFRLSLEPDKTCWGSSVQVLRHQHN